MAESPIAEFLQAVDRLDVEAAMALFEPEAKLLTVDGRRGEGIDEVRELLGSFLAALRSSAHRVTAEWRQEEVWIAEVEATYELRDWSVLRALPRAMVLRQGPEGITDLRIYGAHEHQLPDHSSGEEGVIVGGHWVPPL